MPAESRTRSARFRYGQFLLVYPTFAPVMVPLPNDKTPQTPPPRSIWKRAGMLFINVWLIYHLFAIVMAPASVGPASDLEYSGWQVAAPYLQTFNLNHGYHFFAPNPEGSALVAYLLEFPDGHTESGRFPNRDISPRLLYHRHFMLSEYLGGVEPHLRQSVCKAYAKNLCRQTGAEKVTLSLVTHELPPRDKLLAGASLDDPESYAEEPLGTFSANEL